MTAKMIAHSVGADAPPLATMELRYWRGIHSELMTHRVFSRNSRSSRAVPVPRLIEEVATNPFVPRHWGVNQKGMQAGAEHDAKVILAASDIFGKLWPEKLSREMAWLKARDAAVAAAQAFHDAGYHKQIVNRLLEPFMFIDTLVTATEWTNFFALRDDPMAEPHFRDLAVEMKEAMTASAPKVLRTGDWHLPYVSDEDMNPIIDYWRKAGGNGLQIQRAVSVTRCARISYTPFHGESGDIASEVERHDKLVSAQPMHASPCEHQATPDRIISPWPKDEDPVWENDRLHGNLRGWIQYRKTLQGENQ